MKSTRFLRASKEAQRRAQAETCMPSLQQAPAPMAVEEIWFSEILGFSPRKDLMEKYTEMEKRGHMSLRSTQAQWQGPAFTFW